MHAVGNDKLNKEKSEESGGENYNKLCSTLDEMSVMLLTFQSVTQQEHCAAERMYLERLQLIV